MTYEIPSGDSYAPPNSNMALISVIAGILGLTFIPFAGSVVALILGYIAKKDIKESSGTLGGDGMATAGIVLGWIGIALGVLTFFCIIAIMVPIFSTINW